MKNLVKVFGIIAVIAVIGLAVSCEADPEDQIIVTITEIPAGFEGKWATVSLVKTDGKTPVAAAYPEKIKGGNASGCGMNDISDMTKIFDKDDNYFILLIIHDSESDIENSLYEGVTKSYKTLVKGDNPFPASDFRPDIGDFVAAPPPDFFGTYTAVGYVSTITETIEFQSTTFEISDATTATGAATGDYLKFEIEKWDAAEVPADYSTYTTAYKFTGKITDGKPKDTFVYGTQTAPGFTETDFNSTSCHMYIYCNGSGDTFEFIRTTFTKDTDTTNANEKKAVTTGQNFAGDPRKYSKKK